MTLRKRVIFILGFVLTIVPGQASLTFYTGDSGGGTLTTAVSNWNTATGLTYLSGDLNFSGSLSGSPATYLDATTDLLFAGYTGTGSGGSTVNSTQNSLTLVSTTLKQANTPPIIEITGFAPGTTSFAFEYQTNLSNGTFCIGVNVTSFNESGNCDGQFGVALSTSTGFVGVTSSVPITSVWLGPTYDQTETLSIVNFDAPSAAPEASTMLLLGGGLVLVGLLRYRRRTGEQS